MYIKKIIIQGFKTYKNPTVIDLLSDHHNVIVGRNGSGKSNFFAAIRFVLSDAYTHMTREERRGLIHEGSGTVLSAYVEIVFDNTDRRMPIAKDEISVRRTIGLKKDDYSLDGRAATRSDIMNLLESAGFSRSNPYYIVPQGKITSLTNSKDSERLALLKDVSGAKVFESKLKESMKEMATSDMKKQRIDEALASISDRLSDLQIESNDLKEYQNLERQKKIFEFNLFDRELNDLTAEVEKIDLDYSQTIEKSQDGLDKLESMEITIQQLNDSVNDLQTKLKLASLDKDQLERDYNHLLGTLSSKQLELDQLNQYEYASQDQKKAVQDDIAKYQKLIAEKKSKLREKKPELDKLQEQEKEIKQALIGLSTKQRGLFSKQNRFSKFNTRAERDGWLSEQVAQLSKDLKVKKLETQRLEANIFSKQEELKALELKEIEFQDALKNILESEDAEHLKTAIQNSKAKLAEVSDQRKTLWREEVRLKSSHDSLINDFNKATDKVNQTIDRAQAQGLSALTGITERLGLQENVYGPLSELISVSDKYKTAVEVVAGSSLFHVVVDNDETASKLMEELVKTKAGRLTFIPLNRIHSPLVNYPDSAENQCIPLIKKVKYDNGKIAKAVAHVFARTIVCSDLQRGAELAKSYNINAITLDGDRADTKGLLSGGFRDFKASRLDALKVQAKKKKELIKIAEDMKKCNHDIDSINQQLTSLNNDLQMQIKDLDQLHSKEAPLRSALSQVKDQKHNVEQDLKSYQANLDAVVSIQQSLITNLQQHKEELNSEFSFELSSNELGEMEDLKNEISKFENNLDKVVIKSAELETEIASYDSEIMSHFIPQLEKLLSLQAKSENTTNRYEVRELNTEIQHLKDQIKLVREKSEASTKEFDRLNDENAEKEGSINRLQEKQKKIMKKVEAISKKAEKSLNRKAILSNRRDEVQKKIREIGVLPEEAFDTEKLENVTSDDLLKQLNEVNKGLSKFEHINKKAIEQFNQFTSQQSDLMERREELEVSKASIEKLMQDLETQKEDAVTKSFERIARSFHEIFEQLVPSGVGDLIMLRKSNQANDDDEEDQEEIYVDMDTDQRVADYTGVAIAVSFNSKHDEQQRIEQLSGGQKSLCAIALILAIQRCDPAPFYLFDEIDANLDTQYRTSVASLIQKLSKTAQFICTTFRPEMLQAADKFFGVTFINKISTVSEITRDDATSFVEDQQLN